MSTTEDRAEKVVYELAYLVLPSIPEDNLPQTVTNLKSIINKAGGEEVASEDPFKHPLAYSMSKVVGSSKYVVDEAYIGWVKFELEPGAIEAVKAGVEKIDEILRSLIVKAPRETSFTFAGAREKLREKEEPVEQAEEESKVSETEGDSVESPDTADTEEGESKE